jgi:hypothetical protein
MIACRRDPESHVGDPKIDLTRLTLLCVLADFGVGVP